MTTITIKLNERSKAGKAFMVMANFFRDSKAIEILENPVVTDKSSELKKTYPTSKNLPNAETIKTFKETDADKGLTRVKNSQDFFDAMGI
ncbi:hypothetical protein MCETHM1_00855 [Flavobacteriaceae bacterium]|jgi:antitoxin component of RelBE/YafQ-DinJ toxin-antitoxin module